MTKKPKGSRRTEPGRRISERPRLARGIVRRALTDLVIFDTIISDADAGTPEERARVVQARRLLLAARDPRPWTARAERRLAAYRYARRGVRLPYHERRPMALLLAWAEVPERSGR